MRNSETTTIVRVLLVAVLALSGAQASADVTDPVAYGTFTIPAGRESVVTPFVWPSGWTSMGVTSVEGDTVNFDRSVPPQLFGRLQGGSIHVRVGEWAGASLDVAELHTHHAVIDHPIQGMVEAGDLIVLFPSWTLGGIMGSWDDSWEDTGIHAGQDEADSDLVSFWNAKTQSAETFFAKEGAGWMKVGDPSGQDHSSSSVPFPPALLVTRRGETDLRLIVAGIVVMPNSRRYTWVRPGRNLFTAPILPDSAVVPDLNLFRGSDILGIGASEAAPFADTFRFFTAYGEVSTWHYYRPDGKLIWLSDDTPVPTLSYAPAIEMIRRGAAGFLQVDGLEVSSARLATARSLSSTPADSPEEAEFLGLKQKDGGIQVSWSAEPGHVYQVERRASSSAEWEPWGAEVKATSQVENQICPFEVKGQIRIITKS